MAPRKQFPLRIDPVLWAEIERMAATELRSVNAQVEFMLREEVRRRRPGRLRDASGDEPEPPASRPPERA